MAGAVVDCIFRLDVVFVLFPPPPLSFLFNKLPKIKILYLFPVIIFSFVFFILIIRRRVWGGGGRRDSKTVCRGRSVWVVDSTGGCA